jgi:peptidoglycan hydrolase FlgJ
MTQISALSAAVAGPPGSVKAEDKEALAKAARAFEAIFVRQLISNMRGASGGEAIDGSSGVDQFREMADARMANDLADKGSLGIADLILKQLDR